MNELLVNPEQIDISIMGLMLNLAWALFLGLLLQKHFERFSLAVSGKKELANVLPFLILIVCLIISIVKSSLALSLGLVGALSIVRFWTPIKEPEELAYLFMAIAIGLGLGADQVVATMSSSLVIMVLIILIRWKSMVRAYQALYLNLEFGPQHTTEEIRRLAWPIISEYCDQFDLNRYDSNDAMTVVTVRLEVRGSDEALQLGEKLREQFTSVSVTLIDQSRIPGV